MVSKIILTIVCFLAAIILFGQAFFTNLTDVQFILSILFGIFYLSTGCMGLASIFQSSPKQEELLKPQIKLE